MHKILSYLCAIVLIGLYVANADATYNGSGNGPVQPSAGYSAVTVIVAPSNASAKAKTGANFVCTGTNDDVCINNAINSLPNYSVTGGTVSPANLWHSGKVVLLHGTFNLGATVILDCDFCTLEGENAAMWGGYNHSWTSTASPAGSIGTGEAQLIATATGFPVITLANSNVPSGNGIGGNDQNRHRGVAIRNLYLVGDAYNADCIDTVYGATVSGGDDFSVIEGNQLQRCLNGINIQMDSVIIRANSIQDVAAKGIELSGTNGTIEENLIWDLGGDAMLTTTNCLIQNNTMGDIGGGRGMEIEAGTTVISGNRIVNMNGVAIWLFQSNIVITDNYFQLISNSSATAVYTNNFNNNVISDNLIIQTGASNTNAAIAFGTGTGNIVEGNVIGGGWNNNNGTITGSALTQNVLANNTGAPDLQGGSIFTTTGCSATGQTGTSTTGILTSGTTGTCTVVMTITGRPAVNGYHCNAVDENTGVQLNQTAHTATTCTFAGTTVSGDIVSVTAAAY